MMYKIHQYLQVEKDKIAEEEANQNNWNKINNKLGEEGKKDNLYFSNLLADKFCKNILKKDYERKAYLFGRRNKVSNKSLEARQDRYFVHYLPDV